MLRRRDAGEEIVKRIRADIACGLRNFQSTFPKFERKQTPTTLPLIIYAVFFLKKKGATSNHIARF